MINKYLRFLSFGIILTVFASSIYSQSNIPIGSWKSYLPYQSGRLVTQNEDKVIYATQWSILTIDKEDNAIDFLTKVEGLSDVGIAIIEHDDFNNQLIIGYNNSNIDIVNGDDVINVSDLLTNTNILGDRSIEDIHIASERFCYIATAFGIVELDLQKIEFGFTAFTDLRIYDITTADNIIYAATDDGVYFANLVTSPNLADFSTWSLLDESYGMPVLYNTQVLGSRGSDIYIVAEDSLFSGNLDGFTSVLALDDGFSAQFITEDQGIIMLGLVDEGSQSKVQFFDADNDYVESPFNCVNRLLSAIIDQQGRVWYGDQFNEIRMSPGIGQECQRQTINSPFSHKGSDIGFKDGKVFVASGGVSDAFGYLFSKDGYYQLEDARWTNYDQNNVPIIKDNDIEMIYTVATHPSDNKVFFGSFWAGVLERDLDTDEYTIYNESNSSLRTDVGDPARVKITDMTYDDEGNLWVTNFGAEKPLSVYTAEGIWHSFNINSDTRVSDITIDPNGYKWIVVIGNSGGLLIYDDNGTIADPTDDRQRFLNVGNSTISTNIVNCVDTDLNGDVWLGTAEGPVVFECGANSFDLTGCEGSRRKVLQDSIAAFLLQTEEIRAIEIDGANRKWFGTRRGIFVQSADGEDQEFKFDVSNSPLFDNTINALEYNGETGEMFIISDKGMQVYRTDATDSERTHQENNIYAFPNPVRPDYSGPIAIKGLVEDAKVKITDINGKLVFETTALGGQAIWDGRDYQGVEAATGVYLVFSSSRDNFRDPDAYATKIMLMR